MSIRDPIISVTGSSGAGTTTVRHTFEQSFRHEDIKVCFIEGNAFHRHDRAFLRRAMAEATAAGIGDFSHSGPAATLLEQLAEIFAEYARSGTGRSIHYGVREHAMVAFMNGCAPHRGFIPCGGTFLVFPAYNRPAIRLAALMCQRVILVMTHDSIGLGEDGPTHQPVEHLAAWRAMPNLLVFRPADAIGAASPFGWTQYVTDKDDVIGMNGSGASAPGADLLNHFGFTAATILAKAKQKLAHKEAA